MNVPSCTPDALTPSLGFVTLDDWSCIEVTGADRAKFLHNMCTNDVMKLAPGQGCEAFFTDVKAHILAHVLITCREESIVLTRSAPQSGELITHLDRYVIREDIQLIDRTSDVRYLIIFGAGVDGKLRELSKETELCEAALSNEPIAIGGVSCVLIRFPIPAPAWLIECPSAEITQICEHLVSIGLTQGDSDVWQVIRVENGFPLDRIDVSNQNLPQEVSRNEQAISFKKGCYLGQETVARIDALGHVNQKLTTLVFSGNVVPPRDVSLSADGKTVGSVTSACYSPLHEAPLALAYVRRGHNSPETRLQSEFGSAEVQRVER